MIKEIVIPNYDRSDIENVTIGIFPPKGRYFRKEMVKSEFDFFQIEVDLPLGVSYYHLYLNNDYSKEFKDINSPLLNEFVQRPSFLIKSIFFGHLDFENSLKYVSYLLNDEVELRLISYYSSINTLTLINGDLKEFDFSISYEHNNIKYWFIRINKNEIAKYAIKFCNNSKSYWFIDRKNTSNELNHPFFFVLPQDSNRCKFEDHLLTGYQILPDRFNKSSSQLNRSWLKSGENEFDAKSYFGGDINGITEKLDYLNTLNIDFIYLNPIFYSNSYHRYDTIDYKEIDPILGSKEDLKKLIEKARHLNIKFILDISVNHCSVDFFGFKDLLENQENSKFIDWFLPASFPVSEKEGNYSCWHGLAELPQFNLDNPEVFNYLLDSVIYWTKEFKIDGLRIDVSNEVPIKFLQRFNKKLKKANDSLMIIGENAFDESEDFVHVAKGNGITSYGLYQKVMYPFFYEKSISLTTFINYLFEYLHNHSFYALISSWNFLSNHDVPRFASLLKNKEDLYLAFSTLFFVPGVPVLYYEEELNFDREINETRCTMRWDKLYANNTFLESIKELTSLRSKYANLFKYGSFEILILDQRKEFVCIRRRFDNDSIICSLNFSERPIVIPKNKLFQEGSAYVVIIGNQMEENTLKIESKKISIIKF